MRPDSITVALGYDAAGRPNAVSFDRGTLTLGYSSTTGNLNRIRTPEGDSLLFSYDGSLPTQVRWSGTVDGTVDVIYDNDFRVAGQTVNGADTVLFNYDDDGLLTHAGGLILGRHATTGLLTADTLGRVRSTYQYSSRGELNGYRVKHDTTTLFATGYVRDSLGRMRQLFDTTQGTPTRWSFVYDSLGRLVKDSVNGAVFHVFTYDSNGNRLSVTSGRGTVYSSYDNQDRLLWSRVGTDTTHYRYGSNGELKLKIAPGADTTTYSYDALGNLLAVILPDATELEYVIDGQNRRVGRKVNGDLVQSWLYQNQLNPVAELDSAGTVVSRFIYGSRANVPDFMVRHDSVFRLVTDHLGSVRLVVDTASGTVVQRLDYDEWGVVTTNTNEGFQPFGFAGGLYDETTALVRFGARDYAAVPGRWTSKDPAGFPGDESNRFAYVGNDPTNQTDPTGLGVLDDLISYFQCPTGKSCGEALRGLAVNLTLGSVWDIWRGFKALRTASDFQRIASRKLREMQWRASHDQWELADGLARSATGYESSAATRHLVGATNASLGAVGAGKTLSEGRGQPWTVTALQLLPGIGDLIDLIDAVRSCVPSIQRRLSAL